MKISKILSKVYDKKCDLTDSRARLRDRGCAIFEP